MSTLDPFLDLSKKVISRQTRSSAAQTSAGRARVIQEASGKAATPFWGDSPDVYDSVRFGKDFVLPGVCTVKGRAFEQRLQRDKPPGRHGASIKQLGRQPCHIEITVRMWTDEHLATFERLVPVLKAQRMKTVSSTETVDLGASTTGTGFLESFGATESGGRLARTIETKKSVPAGPAALDVYHPMLALFQIRSVHILAVSFPEPTGEKDVWECRITCEEYVASKAASTAVSVADKSLDIVETNPRVEKTAATRAREEKAKKPSAFGAQPTGSGVRLDFRGGSSGDF